MTRPLATRMRVRFLAAIGAAACGTSTTSEVPMGFVAAPMTSASVTDAGVDAPAVGDPGSKTARPLPTEPKPPTGQSDCTRNAICRAEEEETPTWPLPAPFERCKLSLGKPAAGFSAQETSNARTWDPKACCYVEFVRCNQKKVNIRPVVGRPLRDAYDGAPSVAGTRARGDWSTPVRVRVRVTRAADRTRAARWTEDACMEHASVASFARLTLQLLALGAPARLVEASLRAGLDEVRHARLSFGVASAYTGSEVGPAALDAPHESRPVTLESLALETFRDGCVNESLAAAAARWGAEDETDAAAAAVLSQIACDEERHAELAWQVLAWAIERGGAPVREAIRGARERLLEAGVPDDTRAQTILGEVILPCVDALTRRA